MDIPVWVGIVVVFLAVARVTILFVYDDIMSGFREVLFRFSPPLNDDAKGYYFQNYWRSTKRERKAAKRRGERFLLRQHSYHAKELRRAGFWGQVFSCPDCLGVWIGFVVTVMYHLYPVETVWVSLPFAFSMITSLIARKGRWA